jgi:hypothetical protein
MFKGRVGWVGTPRRRRPQGATVFRAFHFSGTWNNARVFSTAWKKFSTPWKKIAEVFHSMEKVIHSVEKKGENFPQRGKNFP